MRKARKQKFKERKESMNKPHGNPIYSYVSKIDFGNMAYTAKPKQEYCRRWDYRQTVLWREQENQSKTLVVNKIYVVHQKAREIPLVSETYNNMLCEFSIEQ